MTQGITAIGHVAIGVADIDRSLASRAGRLGFPEKLRLHRDDGSPWLVHPRITDEQYLGVLPDAEGERPPPEDANGPSHLCLTGDDLLEAVVARPAGRGVPPFRPPKRGADGNRQAWVEDPDGNRIERMGMAPDGTQARAVERLRQGRGDAT